jgi:predicted O-methyltransferase YrrM
MSEVRAHLRSPQISPFRRLLSYSTLEVLDRLIDDNEIGGNTDSSAISFLAMWIAVNQPENVLQLGTWIGFSTLVLADILRRNSRRGKLVTVDPAKPQQDKARIYVHEAGLDDTVHFIDGKSFDIAVVNSLSAMRPFDLIFVDASHEYRQTLKELTLYLGDGWLSKSGAMFLHDASDYARQFDPTGEGGVRRALDECVRGSLILEPPQWANLCGLAIILSRRRSD